MILLLSSMGEKTEQGITSKVLLDGSVETTFKEVVENYSKPALVLFYSSQNCAPCLQQLQYIKANITELEKEYQLVFVDSWTMGKAKNKQNDTKALKFYQQHLKTENSIFLLDPQDELLATYQKGSNYKYALPYMVVQDSSENKSMASHDFRDALATSKLASL